MKRCELCNYEAGGRRIKCAYCQRLLCSTCFAESDHERRQDMFRRNQRKGSKPNALLSESCTELNPKTKGGTP